MNECKIVSISNTLLKIYEGNAAQLLGWFSGTEKLNQEWPKTVSVRPSGGCHNDF